MLASLEGLKQPPFAWIFPAFQEVFSEPLSDAERKVQPPGPPSRTAMPRTTARRRPRSAATDCSASVASIRLPTPSVFHLHTFHDAEVALRAGAECLKRLLVSLAFVSRPGDVIAVEFDKDRRLLQSGFVGLHLARGHRQKAPAE